MFACPQESTLLTKAVLTDRAKVKKVDTASRGALTSILWFRAATVTLYPQPASYSTPEPSGICAQPQEEFFARAFFFFVSPCWAHSGPDSQNAVGKSNLQKGFSKSLLNCIGTGLAFCPTWPWHIDFQGHLPQGPAAGSRGFGKPVVWVQAFPRAPASFSYPYTWQRWPALPMVKLF